MDEKLIISDRFDLNDIRKIREYNSARYENMSSAEITKDIKAGAQKVLKLLKEQMSDN